MTVPTEACYAERVYTGVETIFTPGFAAFSGADVHVSYFDSTGVKIELTLGVHFLVSLDGGGAVTVTRIAFPAASADQPVILAFERITPAIQGTDFTNLNRYDAALHGRLADAAAMRDAELRGKMLRDQQPFTTSDAAVDFRPRTVRAAEPVAASDLATKFYADEVSGSNAQAGAEAARDIAVAAAAEASADAAAAAGSAGLAETYADILSNPDYGFYVDIPTTSRDYGTYV
ncbi:MAG: hypothetical protein WC670_18915 [Pseudolabrys sp.]|jgi:hypothetical protein